MFQVLLDVLKDQNPVRSLELSIYYPLFFPYPFYSALCLHTGQVDDLPTLLMICTELEVYVIVIQNRAMEDELE